MHGPTLPSCTTHRHGVPPLCGSKFSYKIRTRLDGLCRDPDHTAPRHEGSRSTNSAMSARRRIDGCCRPIVSRKGRSHSLCGRAALTHLSLRERAAAGVIASVSRSNQGLLAAAVRQEARSRTALAAEAGAGELAPGRSVWGCALRCPHLAPQAGGAAAGSKGGPAAPNGVACWSVLRDAPSALLEGRGSGGPPVQSVRGICADCRPAIYRANVFGEES
jgi:hypothetical protein